MIRNNPLKGVIVIKSLFFQESFSVSVSLPYYSLLLTPKEPFFCKTLTGHEHSYLMTVVPVFPQEEKMVLASDLISRTMTTIVIFWGLSMSQVSF